MASGFLTSHLRNVSRHDSPGGTGPSGHGLGTGTRYWKWSSLIKWLADGQELVSVLLHFWVKQKSHCLKIAPQLLGLLLCHTDWTIKWYLMDYIALKIITSYKLRDQNVSIWPGYCFSSCSAVGSSSPLHYSALHSHQSRIVTSSPGTHSRVHSPSISNMAALRWG